MWSAKKAHFTALVRAPRTITVLDENKTPIGTKKKKNESKSRSLARNKETMTAFVVAPFAFLSPTSHLPTLTHYQQTQTPTHTHTHKQTTKSLCLQ